MAPTDKNFTGRFVLILIGAIAVWLVLVGKLYLIQIVHGDEYRSIGTRQAENREPIPALRGHIYDRDQNQLTMNVRQYSFGAHPARVENPYGLASAFARHFGNARHTYLRRLRSAKPFVWLERNIDKVRAEPILEMSDPGLVPKQETERHYPYRELGAQILGATNVDGKGINGIEAQYDSLLAGQDGWTILKSDGRGESLPSPSFPSIDPIDGHGIQLTLDLEFQSIVEEALARGMDRYNASSGMALVLDPQTGAIRAMASLPSYDPNQLHRSRPGQMKNRTITDIFEPGSTVKIVALTAALEEELIELDQLFYCEEGEIVVEGETIHDWKPYGWLTFRDVIINSSNVGVIKAAREIGSPTLYRYLRKYGFGTETGVDLLGEVSGVVHPLKEWREISRASVSIGHEMSTTALQLAMAYVAIANDGYLMKPFIVKRIFDQSGETVYNGNPQVIRQVASEETMTRIRGILRDVVAEGTGQNASMNGIEIGGKTGTAQKVIDGKYSQRKYISSFVGFLPVDHPRLLCAVILDAPEYGHHWGGYAAAPIVKNIFSQIINTTDDHFLVADREEETRSTPAEKKTREVRASNSPFVSLLSRSMLQSPSAEESMPKSRPIQMPDVRGMSLRKALVELYRLDLEVSINGYGKVVKQSPRAGVSVTPGTQCQLELSN